MKQLPSWHHHVYDDIEFWDDQRVIETYYRLSLDLRIRKVDALEHFDRMGQVELELRERNLDPDRIARAVQTEIRRTTDNFFQPNRSIELEPENQKSPMAESDYRPE